MYRHFCIASIAVGLCVSSLTQAQESNLETVFVEDLQPAESQVVQRPPDKQQAVQPTAPSPAVQQQPPDPPLIPRKQAQRQASQRRSSQPKPAQPLATPSHGNANARQKPLTLIDFDSMFELAGEETEVDSTPVDASKHASPLPAADSRTGSSVILTSQADDGGMLMDESPMLSSAPAAPIVYPDAASVVSVPNCDTCRNCDCRQKCCCATHRRSQTCCANCYQRHVFNLGQRGRFCERPFGTCNEGFVNAMIMAGKQARAVLHHYDFAQHRDGNVALTGRGKYELNRIARLIREYGVMLEIESTRDLDHDAARHSAVVDAIARLGLPIAPDQIRISVDRTVGLNGSDGQAIELTRTTEMLTGALRTRPFLDSAQATVIPVPTQDSSSGGILP